MEALEYRHRVVRYLLTRGTHRFVRWAWSVRLAPLYRVELPLPVPRRPGWLRLRVRQAGICGTDYHLITGSGSLSLEPEATYPFVPGHEIVASIDSGQSIDNSVSPELQEGTRVAVWSALGCRAHGIDPPCQFCQRGWDGLCEARDTTWPGAGVALGFNRDTGGGWAEACLAHESQVWPLPDDVCDEDAVLLDPAATALAGLLRNDNPDVERTLVVGGGTIGLLVAILHRGLGLNGECELLVRHSYQASWARQRGLSAGVVRGRKMFHAWATDRGLDSKRVVGYGHVFRGAYDRVIDAAGTQSSLIQALNAVRPGGHIVLLSAPNTLARVDPTSLWYREVTLTGVNMYGPVPWKGEPRHPFDILLPMLADGSVRFRDLVTHSFPLRSYVDAFDTLKQRDKTGAIKVTFVGRDAAAQCIGEAKSVRK